MQARVSALRRQLEKLDGGSVPAVNVLAKNDPAKNDLARNATSPVEHSAYPSLRELPLLGVTYADLLRRTRIQETVYETLTQQYELAKVQEAKETPSVKVLDAASLPERKVFPPRLLIMFWGALLGLAAAAFWVLGETRWRHLDSRNPAKLLAHDILQTVMAAMPWATLNGSQAGGLARRVWRRIAEPNPPPQTGLPEIHSSQIQEEAHDRVG